MGATLPRSTSINSSDLNRRRGLIVNMALPGGHWGFVWQNLFVICILWCDLRNAVELLGRLPEGVSGCYGGSVLAYCGSILTASILGESSPGCMLWVYRF